MNSTSDWRLSCFGERFTAQTGILQLMDDLGQAMAGRADMRMLGGGNPAHIPDVQAVWRRRMQELLADGAAFDRMLANYDPPRGRPDFLDELAAFLRRQLGWPVTPENIAVTNGGQTALFCLFNMLAGAMPDGSFRRILFPLMPEYIGYADQGLHPDLFTAVRPRIEEIGDRRFKYHVDFDRLRVTPDVAAICVSRPTNPTGNVLTDDEVERLAALAGRHGIPLILDNAYGLPFPGIIFTDVKPFWNGNTILTMSLSKLGLPGVRTGIVIGPPSIAKAISSLNAILCLATGNVGPALVTPLLKNDEIAQLSREVIQPYYRRRSEEAQAWVGESIDPAIPYRLHVSEGALFLWLWFPGLPVPARELYARLKRRGVLVVPGEYFFYGLDEDWPHRHECLRVTYSQSPDAVREGIWMLGEEVRAVWRT